MGIDIRVLVLGKRTGVEEYLLNLLPRMIEKNPEITFRLFYNAWRKQKLAYPWLNAGNVELNERSIPNRPLLAAHALVDWPKADKLIGGCDVFWSPHMVNVALSRNVRHVITVHDLAFERYPEFFSREKLWWHRYLMIPRRQLASADHLIAVSHSTKHDLGNLYGIPKERIGVIYPGVGNEFLPLEKTNPRLYEVKKKYRLPEHFILYFGTLEPRKNITGLIKAFGILKSYQLSAKSYKLVIAGTKGWLCRDIFKTAKISSYSDDIVFTGFVADEDKPALYNLAEAFVYPSFFEGFGFPPLEAMACGVPVVTSNRSSLPEVCGNAAILIDPYRPSEMAEAISTLLSGARAKEMMVGRGIERTKMFSWDVCAKNTLRALLGE